jgi:hypothetical protein
MTTDERKARELLQLPECWCGEGLECPEITVNLIGHHNERAVARIIRAAKKKTKR